MINYYNQAKEKINLHNIEMKRCKTKNDILSILNIGLVSLAGIANNVLTDKGAILSNVFSGILYASLVVTGVQRYFNYEELVEKHKVSSLMYSVLVENIDSDLIPLQYIRSQYQFLKAIEPYVATKNEEIPNDFVNTLAFELARSRDS